MSRWFRFEDDALNDPKLLRLSDRMFRIWIGLLCVASKHAGRLPPMEDIALMLRQQPELGLPSTPRITASPSRTNCFCGSAAQPGQSRDIDRSSHGRCG
jgi:hypothetical protein